MPPQPRVIDGRFQLEGELGRGGMGVVYRAWDLQAKRHVALKSVIADELTAERLARFQREGEVTATLDHPGVVRVHAAGSHEGRPYLAYELVEGARELEQAMSGAPQRQVLQWICAAAEALGAAHAQGVVHRDVKPENVLIDAQGHVRVADFGLALAIDTERLTRTGAMLGTPHYMAPELFAGKAFGEVGPATDVWALGVLLYRVLTDEFPFPGVTIYELAAQVNAAAIAPPRALKPGVPRSLNSVCLKALERSPSARYACGAAFASDLGRALRGEAVEARGRSPLSGLLKRWPWLLAGAAVVGAVATALLFDPSARAVEGTNTQRAAQAKSTSPDRSPSDVPAESPDDSPGATPRHSPETKTGQPSMPDVINYLGERLKLSDGKRSGIVAYQTAELFRKSKDWREAVKWYARSAEEGYARGARRLGDAHREGALGQQVDFAKAESWYRRGVELSDADSSLALARMIWERRAKGDGADALRLALVAAEDNDHRAMRLVIVIARRGGEGLEPNPDLARTWRARLDKHPKEIKDQRRRAKRRKRQRAGELDRK